MAEHVWIINLCECGLLDSVGPGACLAAGHGHEQGREIAVVAVESVERLEKALSVAESALLDVTRTRRSDAWGMAVARAQEALTEIQDATKGNHAD